MKTYYITELSAYALHKGKRPISLDVCHNIRTAKRIARENALALPATVPKNIYVCTVDSEGELQPFLMVYPAYDGRSSGVVIRECEDITIDNIKYCTINK